MTEVETRTAAVLLAWLRDHGHPVVGDDELVPIGWLRDQLQHLREAPVLDGRATPATAWRRALGAVLEVLHRYELEHDDLAPTAPGPEGSTP